jgi:hypothetical protein
MSKILACIEKLKSNVTHPKWLSEALGEIKDEFDAMKTRIDGMEVAIGLREPAAPATSPPAASAAPSSTEPVSAVAPAAPVVPPAPIAPAVPATA